MFKNFETQRPYSCTSLFGQRFSIKVRWKAHEELNFPRAWWLCKFCADIFPRKDRLRDHKKKQHGQSKINADEQHTAKQRERFFRPCFFACSYLGDDFDQWINHVDKHFAIDVINGTYHGEPAEAVAGNVLSILKEIKKQAPSIARSLEPPLGQDPSRTVREQAEPAELMYEENTGTASQMATLIQPYGYWQGPPVQRTGYLGRPPPPPPLRSQPRPELSRPTSAFTTLWADKEKRKHDEMVRLMYRKNR
ncbi:hypothetical protein GJ744_005607 [Endocarpon pusillum]|uniref:C2H2-type domain-containing protein n=1 Tax=Endocarpon pusillum TaxID=364733 RepID=A0A8H7A712_9EURO|nr:hypothetical protein GJ744_005607 [Endocarpon pusillum]